MRELFRREALAVDTQPRSWREAIRVAGALLLDAGSIEAGYIDAMIDAVETLGPYMVVAPHFAIAHAAAGAHVVKDDMALVVFREPVLFSTPNDPVHLMIGMCALRPESHLEQFRGLAELLTDEDVWQKFAASKTVDQLYRLANGKSGGKEGRA